MRNDFYKLYSNQFNSFRLNFQSKILLILFKKFAKPAGFDLYFLMRNTPFYPHLAAKMRWPKPRFEPGCPFASADPENSSLEGQAKLSRGHNLPSKASGLGPVDEIGQDNDNSLL